MTIKTKLIVSCLLIMLAALLIWLEAPFLYCLVAIISAIVFPVEVFIRRPANAALGLNNKHLGGGYYSGGRLPYVSRDRNASGSGGARANGVKVGGANGGGFFGQNR